MIPRYDTLAGWAPLMIATGILCLVLLLLAYLARDVAKSLLRRDDSVEVVRSTRSGKAAAKAAEANRAERSARLEQVDRYRKTSGALLFVAYLALALALLPVGLLLLPPWFGIAVAIALIVLSVLMFRLLVSPGPASALLRLDIAEPEEEAQADA